MTDSVQVFPPGFRVTDNSTGAPVSGAKIKFYDAGTTTPKTVYSNSGLSSSLGSTVYTDSMGTPVAASGSNTAVMVYTGTAAYKVVITDDDDATIRTLDNIKGALDTSTFLTTGSTSSLSIPVVTKTANYTAVAADNGKLINCNSTGGSFTITLDSAVTLGDGWSLEMRNAGTDSANVAYLSASQAIAFEGSSFTTRALQIGEAASIRCDGSAFKIVGHTPPLMASRGPAVITIVGRAGSSPGALVAGARYIVSVAFSTYSVGDIIEANGTSFNVYTPATNCGWLAYVQSENQYYSFQDSAWVKVFPQSSDTLAGVIELAVQSEMETGTDVARAVTPGLQHYHPAHPKAFVTFNSAGTVQRGHNVTSITDGGTGIWTVNWAITFSDINYAIAGWIVGGVDSAYLSTDNTDVKTTTATPVKGYGSNGAATDGTQIHVLALGDL